MNIAQAYFEQKFENAFLRAKGNEFQTFFERLMGLADHLGLSKASIDAAISGNAQRPLYQHLAIAALLMGFADSESGQAVAAANKRIANILKKVGDVALDVDPALLLEAAEQDLYDKLCDAESSFPTEPEHQLNVLADLREAVDGFFDDVMVMAEDEKLRANRLALLARLRALFLRLADISRL